MKRLFAAFILSLFLGSVGTILLTPGCTTTQQATAFKTLSGLEISTDGAYKAYLDLVVAGKVATNSVPAVSRDYVAFQVVMRTSITLAQGNTNAVAPQTALDSAAKVVADIATAKGGK